MTAASTVAATPQARRAPWAADHRLVFSPARSVGGLACWIAVPAHADPAAPPLVAVHGIRRRAEEQAALFGARAAAQGRHVIAPLFDAENWPTYARIGHRRRADLALIELLEQLKRERVGQYDRFDLFGFSGGAQFAHRFAMLHPQRITRLSVASAGWYTFPDQAEYPYGLGQRAGRADDHASRMRTALDAFLRLPMRVCVGALDNVRDANTREGAELDLQQGRDRKARAARWVEAIEIAAAVRGIVPRVRLSVLPGCGHDFRRCMKRGALADAVFDESTADAMLRWLSEPGLRAIAPRRTAMLRLAAGVC